MHTARICRNMLVCPVAPAIQNYNMLILAFSLLEEHDLSTAVVDSFLFLSHMKPTEATYLCLLQHYRLKGDVVGFHRLLGRMFGHDPRGIGIMRRTADHVLAQPALHEWARSPNVALVKGYHVQRAPFTQDIAETIMEGLVDFGMLREAAKLLAVCLGAKWTVSRDLLWRLFHSCLTMVDTGAIKLVVRGLLDNIDVATAMLVGPEPVGTGTVRQLHHLLNAWQATTLPRKGSAGIKRSRTSDPARERQKARLDHLITAIWIREAQHYSSMVSWWLKYIRRTLSNENIPLITRVDKALRVLDLAAGHPVQKLQKAEQIRRVSKIHWLTSELVVSDYRIRNAENAICNVLSKQTPRPLRAIEHFQAHVPIGVRVRLAMAYSTPGTVQYEIAQCFKASTEIDRRIKSAVMKAFPASYAKEVRKKQNDTGDISLASSLVYFEQYLAGLASELVKDEENTAAQPGRFARLLEKWTKKGFFLWGGEDATATVTATTSAAPCSRRRPIPTSAMAANAAPLGRSAGW
jgi:hypothetical protein